MELFKQLPSSDQIYKHRIDEETEELTHSMDIDVFDDEQKSILDSMQEEIKSNMKSEDGENISSGLLSPTMNVNNPGSASRLSLILSECGGPENEQ